MMARTSQLSPQSDGRGIHADFHIVISIDHGVLGVVRPAPRTGCRSTSAHACQGHVRPVTAGDSRGNAKAERHAQHCLRHGDKAFGIRIRRRRRPSAAKDHATGSTRIGSEHQRERRAAPAPRPRPRLLLRARHSPAGHRGRSYAAVRCACRSKVAVGHIVDTASRAAHQNTVPKREHQRSNATPGNHRLPIHSAARREGQSSSSQPADRFQRIKSKYKGRALTHSRQSG